MGGARIADLHRRLGLFEKVFEKKTGLFDCEGLSEICRFMQYFVIIVSNQIAIYFI